MPTKRLFTAIKIHPDQRLIDTIEFLKKELYREPIKWVDLNNIHLTLKFFGETDISKIPSISALFQKISKTHVVFNIELEKCGVFDNFRNPRVIWVGIKNNDDLSALNDKINTNLEKLGYEREKRAFKPHLTLGRVKFIRNKEHFKESILKYADYTFHSELIDSFILYESILKPQGPHYREIAQFPLCKV